MPGFADIVNEPVCGLRCHGPDGIALLIAIHTPGVAAGCGEDRVGAHSLFIPCHRFEQENRLLILPDLVVVCLDEIAGQCKRF